MSDLDDVARAHHAFITRDSVFQRRLRLAQALWRQDQGLPIGTHRGQPLGSRIEESVAGEGLGNYLTDTIREVVREEVEGPRAAGKLFAKPRIYNDLLSSQPLCFNLFGELAADTDGLATRACRLLWPERVDKVETIQFEHSPGRGDDRYLGNRTAFDVYIEHSTPGGGRGFIGIEVKYHENLVGEAAGMRDRLLEVADAAGIFPAEHRAALETPPLQQIWFDHLLALSMLEAEAGWESGLFVFLYPAGNAPCARASRLSYSRQAARGTASGRLVMASRSNGKTSRAM